MTRVQMRRAAAAVLGLAAVAWAGAGRAQQGAAERAAERVGGALDNTGRAIRRGVQGAGSTVREGFARSRAAVHDMGVVSRVYSRLHWDKALTSSTLEMEVQDGGVAILRGVVPDAAARARAVALTRDTVGVVEVIDELTVVPAPRAVPAATSARTAPPIR
jgi:hyperosmotically inducible periplasmic protein